MATSLLAGKLEDRKWGGARNCDPLSQLEVH